MLFLTYNDSRDGEHYTAHYQHYHWYVTAKHDDEQRRRYYFL